MIFDNVATKKVLQYIKQNYARELEFLWSKTPSNAVFRHSNSLKWFAVILNIPKQKLGIEAEGNVNILDLKCDPVFIGSLRDKKNYFTAYHMNKEHWITILLDDNTELDEVFALINLSFSITNS